MARQKVTTIFNKNHITIEVIENPERNYVGDHVCEYAEVSTYCPTKYIFGDEEEVKETVKLKSRLGFYYTKEITYKKYKHDRNKYNERRWKIVTYRVGNTIYKLKFLILWDENAVRQTEDSLRPWEIAEGDKSLNDNMLNSLVTDLNNFFSDMEINKITAFYKSNGSYSSASNVNMTLYDLKTDVYKYMFGNKKGLRFQTDMEKLISHGFDPKYSFRKDKEKKN